MSMWGATEQDWLGTPADELTTLRAQVSQLTTDLEASLDMLRWSRAALDSGYRTTRARQEIAKIDEFFSARSTIRNPVP